MTTGLEEENLWIQNNYNLLKNDFELHSSNDRDIG